MRLAIDALAARFGGTAYMVAQIASALGDRDDVEHVWVLVTAGSVADESLREHPKITRVAPLADARLSLPRRAIWEAVQLPRLLAAHSVERLLTVSGMLPRRPRCSLFVHLTNPVAYERGGGANRLRRLLIRRTIGRADAVLVPTGAMADLVAADTGVHPLVLPLGVDRGIFSPPEGPGREILCVADFYPHKRHDLAFAAWSRLAEPRPRMRFIGNPAVDPPTYRSVCDRARSLDPGGGLLSVEGRVPLRALLEAYRSAAIFLLPSEHESFSLPLAEALTCGVPAVVRDLPSLRETGGDAATFVASDEPGEWSAALQCLLDDEDLHRRRRACALRHAESFSWPALAAALVQGPTRRPPK